MGYCLKEPTGFFDNLIKMCPSCAWATHQKFFHKIPGNLITMCPAIYSTGSLRVCGKIEPNWEFLLKSFKWTHWVSFGQIPGYILKELWGFFQWVAQGYIGGLFWGTFKTYPLIPSRSKWWVHWEIAHHLPTRFSKGKLFKNSQQTLNVPTR